MICGRCVREKLWNLLWWKISQNIFPWPFNNCLVKKSCTIYWKDKWWAGKQPKLSIYDQLTYNYIFQRSFWSTSKWITRAELYCLNKLGFGMNSTLKNYSSSRENGSREGRKNQRNIANINIFYRWGLQYPQQRGKTSSIWGWH